MRALVLAAALAAAIVRPALAQLPPDVARERADFAAWLAGAPVSPLAAVAQQPIGPGVRLGPTDADIPLPGVSEHRVSDRGGALRLEGPEGVRGLPRGVPVRLGQHTLVADGPPGRSVLMVFGPTRRPGTPSYYPYRSDLVVTGRLVPAAQHALVPVLGLDGIEVSAAEAGMVEATVAGTPVRLRVRRLPSNGAEESELEVFFRDASNGHGTYPAGRFVTVEPLPGGRARLDFNGARNPFCVYSSVYACPAPWPGNSLAAAIEAGERYEHAP